METQQDARPRLKVITVRCPEQLHRALSYLAWRRRTSVNQLCVDTLETLIEEAGLADSVVGQAVTHEPITAGKSRPR